MKITEKEAVAIDAAANPASEEWAIVELFGHVKHVGKIFEVERFGGKMLRIDCPVMDGTGKWTTHFVGDKSIYRLTITDEATVMALVERARALPSPYRYVDDADDDGY